MRPKRVMDAIVPLIMYWVIGDLGYIYSTSISHTWGKCMTCIYILYASTFLLAPACQALQQQRATVERMSLAPPAHIEIVDCYAHRGEVDDVHYTMPWAMGESGTVPLVIVSSILLLSLGPG